MFLIGSLTLRNGYRGLYAAVKGVAILKVYLASPLGFSESGRYFLFQKLLPSLMEMKLDIINPWQSLEDIRWEDVVGRIRKASSVKNNMQLARVNANSIQEADFVIALLDGPDVDSGVASEIGYAYALGKKILGYRSDFRTVGDNPNANINLQVEWFIDASGGSIAQSLEQLISLLNKLERQIPTKSGKTVSPQQVAESKAQ